MFGHQEDSDQDNNNQVDQNNPQADGTLTHSSVGIMPTQQTDEGAMTPLPAPTDNDTNDSAGDYIMTEPQHAQASSAAPAPASNTPTTPVTTATHVPADDLIDIKQKALQQLSPLVGHLNQTPEEKFRTTMMMIQASDDQTLLKAAYEAAGQITDEKTRAQALLDVINEINYFTQQQEA
jgi:hypothetical protein